METELLWLISTGGGVVLFATIIIFLKESGKRDAVIKILQAQINAIFTEMRLAHSGQMTAMIEQMKEQQKYFQEQFHKDIQRQSGHQIATIAELRDIMHSWGESHRGN